MAKRSSYNFSMSSRSPEEQAALKAKIAAIYKKTPASTAQRVSDSINKSFGLPTQTSSDARGKDAATQVNINPTQPQFAPGTGPGYENPSMDRMISNGAARDRASIASSGQPIGDVGTKNVSFTGGDQPRDELGRFASR